MKGVLKSSRHGTGRGAHHHIVYLNDEGEVPVGAASPGKHNGHNHPVVFDEVVGTWVLGPSEDDGHTHSLEEYQVKIKKKKQEEQEIVADVIQIYRSCKEHESDSCKKAKESEEFYSGEQWSNDQKRKLEEQSRAALTINKIQKNIDELSGHQRQQRTDIRYLPEEDGDQRAADLYTLVGKHILTKCFYSREESKAFLDTIITGRGNFQLRVDFTKNIQGEIKVDRYPWNEVYYGPHEKEDLEDCEVVVKTKWYAESKLASLYPEKREDLQKSYEDLEDYSETLKGYSSDNYRQAENERPALGPDYVNVVKKEFRVIEAQRRTYEKVHVLTNPNDEFFFSAENWEPSDLELAKTIPGLFAIPRYYCKIRITKIAGTVLLEDEYPADVPYEDFDLIPIYATKRGDKWWGKVEAAKDPQKEINKRHSQAVDIANKMAAYGWFYDANTFPSDTEKDKFKQNSSSPGFAVELSSTTQPPVKVEGIKFPTELVQLLALGDQELAEIMNIVVDQVGANDSGIAILQKTKLKLTGNEYLFDNLSFAKHKLGRMLLKAIQRFYSPERIYRIVSNRKQDEEAMIAGQPVDSFSKEEILEILSNAEAAEFDVVVDESTYSPTARLAIFMILSDLAKGGLPIPPEALIEFMDTIPKAQKDRILGAIQAQAQAEQQAEEMKMQMEIGKTMIAKGVMPQGGGMEAPGQQPQEMSPPPAGPPPQM